MPTPRPFRDARVEVTLEAARKAWGTMKGRLEDLNLAYPTRAKDKGWVNSTKSATYVLRPEWQEILRAN
jgi:hypothetical protein